MQFLYYLVALLLSQESRSGVIMKRKKKKKHMHKISIDEDWKTLSKRGWYAMRDELQRSLEDLAIEKLSLAQVEEVVLHMFKRRDAFVLILNNKILVTRAFLGRGVKYYRHVAMMRTAFDRISPVPNAIYQFEGGASGTSNRYECGTSDQGDDSAGIGHLTRDRDDKSYYKRFRKAVPRLCIAKREGYSKCGSFDY
mmetsp:Transcript_20201/g.30786  ORF Transcript_20201/g.30786 Transcript_20201/m.30786 type:complete len:196 (-) Transcript_20201:1036-1623(-)